MNADHFALSTLDLTIIIAELVLVIVVGLWAARGVDTSARSYFLAEGKMPWWLIGLAFVSTSVSSEQIVGTVGATYKHGMGMANWEWWCLPTYVLLMVFFIPLYLKNKVTTVPELFRRRFGPGCADIYSYLMLVCYVCVFLAPVLYGGSLTLSKLTGWPLWAVLAGTVVFVGAYTIKGGLNSVMWTDAVQCVLLVLGGVVLFFIALTHIPGGWTAMQQAAPERFHLYNPPEHEDAPLLGLIAATFGVFLFYQSTNQVMIQRILGARSTWDGLMGVVFAGFINLIRPLVTCLLGLVVWHYIEVMGRAPSLLPDRQDEAFPFALAVFAPSGLRGLILAGFIAAVMSTVSALANSIGTIFSLDLYQRFRPSAGDKELVISGKLASALALILAALLAPLVGTVGVFKYFQTGVTYMATPFVSVILMGFLWKRTSYPAALAGLIGGLVIQITLAFALPAAGLKLNFLYVGAIAQALTMLLVIAVTFMTPPASRAQWEPFHWTPAVFAAASDGRSRPWWQRVRFWFAIYAVVWVSIYVWFW